MTTSENLEERYTPGSDTKTFPHLNTYWKNEKSGEYYWVKGIKYYSNRPCYNCVRLTYNGEIYQIQHDLTFSEYETKECIQINNEEYLIILDKIRELYEFKMSIIDDRECLYPNEKYSLTCEDYLKYMYEYFIFFPTINSKNVVRLAKVDATNILSENGVIKEFSCLYTHFATYTKLLDSGDREYFVMITPEKPTIMLTNGNTRMSIHERNKRVFESETRNEIYPISKWRYEQILEAIKLLPYEPGVNN